MDETIYAIFKVQFDFALEVWFSIYLNIFTHLLSWARGIILDLGPGSSVVVSWSSQGSSPMQ